MMLYSKKQIRKALKKEKVKWANIYQDHKGDGKDCPLCDMYMFMNDCRMCPIMTKTGLPNCVGTPYNEWVRHQKNEHGVDMSNGIVVRCSECKLLAKKQATFISMLLKEK